MVDTKHTPIEKLISEAVDLLSALIQIPSYSKEEKDTAQLLAHTLQLHGFKPRQLGNNVWALDPFFSDDKPTLLLNSHHDTVKPNPAYTRNPFTATIENGKLYGLGSNDAGGALVSLLYTFFVLSHKQDRPYNLLFLATAEEEISGKNGMETVLKELPPIWAAIVGEPTQMEVAIAEKGLMVVDCVAYGVAGHAAREEGENAIYKAMRDIEWFSSFSFAKKSPTLGAVKMSVTQVEAGSQHNVVPAECRFVVDVRLTDAYTPEEVLAVIRSKVAATVKPRSTRLRPSGIDAHHPLVVCAEAMGCRTYGSVTLSDQALLPCPSIKMGPGDSARSHTADEFIYVDEIESGMRGYIQLLQKLSSQI